MELELNKYYSPMVKKKIDEFISNLEKFYSVAKEKNSVYLTFKRGIIVIIQVYKENLKFKTNKKRRKQRTEDRKKQETPDAKFSILVRAKYKDSRIQTVVNENEIDTFHHLLINVLTLHYIREDEIPKPKPKQMPKRTMTKTQRRKLRREKRIAKRLASQKANQVVTNPKETVNAK